MINEDLEIMPETRLGNYNSWEVYSADVIGDFIYFGLSDFSVATAFCFCLTFFIRGSSASSDSI